MLAYSHPRQFLSPGCPYRAHASALILRAESPRRTLKPPAASTCTGMGTHASTGTGTGAGAGAKYWSQFQPLVCSSQSA
eukprot:7203146-Prymnesium_polylepis.1